MRTILMAWTLLILLSGCNKAKKAQVASTHCAAALDGHIYSNGVPQGQPLRNTLSFEAGKIQYSSADVDYGEVQYICQVRSLTWTAADTKFQAEILAQDEIKLFTEVLKLEK